MQGLKTRVYFSPVNSCSILNDDLSKRREVIINSSGQHSTVYIVQDWIHCFHYITICNAHLSFFSFVFSSLVILNSIYCIFSGNQEARLLSLTWKGDGHETNLLSDFIATQPSQWPWPLTREVVNFNHCRSWSWIIVPGLCIPEVQPVT